MFKCVCDVCDVCVWEESFTWVSRRSVYFIQTEGVLTKPLDNYGVGTWSGFGLLLEVECICN